jgi:hypothetical protein
VSAVEGGSEAGRRWPGVPLISGEDRLASLGVGDADGAGGAVARGFQDHVLGGAGGVDDLRLAIVVVAEDLWREEDALAVPHADGVVDGDVKNPFQNEALCRRAALDGAMLRPRLRP